MITRRHTFDSSVPEANWQQWRRWAAVPTAPAAQPAVEEAGYRTERRRLVLEAVAAAEIHHASEDTPLQI